MADTLESASERRSSQKYLSPSLLLSATGAGRHCFSLLSSGLFCCRSWSAVFLLVFRQSHLGPEHRQPDAPFDARQPQQQREERAENRVPFRAGRKLMEQHKSRRTAERRRGVKINFPSEHQRNFADEQVAQNAA